MGFFDEIFMKWMLQIEKNDSVITVIVWFSFLNFGFERKKNWGSSQVMSHNFDSNTYTQ